jgi:hypothetical protein
VRVVRAEGSLVPKLELGNQDTREPGKERRRRFASVSGLSHIGAGVRTMEHDMLSAGHDPETGERGPPKLERTRVMMPLFPLELHVKAALSREHRG